ncbi:MAG TPA: sensor domain-containing diguanylate cyclase [Gaiellaceae bacterium]|jgi:diguanylate cyclase (GGDEF)-like protein
MSPLAETGTWLAIGAAAAAAVVALAVSLVLLAVVVRRGDDEEAALEPDAPPEGARLPATRRVWPWMRRSHGEIASSLDLDVVLQRALYAATSTAGADAALLVIDQEDDDPLVATTGMTAEEAARQQVSSSPAPGARAVQVTFRYGSADEPAPVAGPGVIRSGVVVPVQEDHVGTVGSLAVFWRSDEGAMDDEGLDDLEGLAASCAPAIKNALRFREARRLADVDLLTGLHNRRYFQETLARECARAHRYERGLALLMLDVDDFSAINDDFGHLGGDAVLAAVADRLVTIVRQADVACRVGADSFAILLPEAGERDAEQLYNRIQFAVGSGSTGPAERVRLSAGIAELRPEDDAVSLFQRTDEALDNAQLGGKGRVQLAGRTGGAGGS